MTKRLYTEEVLLNAQFAEVFDAAQQIVITTHLNPDGDAFGSGLAVYNFINAHFDKKVSFISPTTYSDFLGWMPNVVDTVVFDGPIANALAAEADLIICLDFSSINRLKDFGPAVLASKAKKLVIDHHEQPEDFGDFYFWNQLASSTCELVYQWFRIWQPNLAISKTVGTCIYTGLLTDTGSFRFNSTTPEVHHVAADLLKTGVEPNTIHRALFDNNSLTRLKMLGYVLSQKLQIVPGLPVAYMSLSAEELASFDSKSGDTEGLVNYGLSIEGVAMSAIFVEKDGLVKISFRSVGDISVADFSRNHFEGGGHKNAAGGRSEISLQETINKFLNLLPNYKKDFFNL